MANAVKRTMKLFIWMAMFEDVRLLQKFLTVQEAGWTDVKM